MVSLFRPGKARVKLSNTVQDLKQNSRTFQDSKKNPGLFQDVATLVTIQSNGQKNDVRCEYTRGAPEPSFCRFQLIYMRTDHDYFCACGA